MSQDVVASWVTQAVPEQEKYFEVLSGKRNVMLTPVGWLTGNYLPLPQGVFTSLKLFDTPPIPDPTGGVKETLHGVQAILSYRR